MGRWKRLETSGTVTNNFRIRYVLRLILGRPLTTVTETARPDFLTIAVLLKIQFL
jgi:hypothetical protein